MSSICYIPSIYIYTHTCIGQFHHHHHHHYYYYYYYYYYYNNN